MKEFGNSDLAMASFVVSVYVLGFAFGPLVMAPLSEIYGRVPIFHACNVGFVVFLVACALAPSIDSLIAFRFLSGLFGSCAITNGGGSIADMVTQEVGALSHPWSGRLPPHNCCVKIMTSCYCIETCHGHGGLRNRYYSAPFSLLLFPLWLERASKHRLDHFLQANTNASLPQVHCSDQ